MLHITSNYTLTILCGDPHNVCNEEGKIDGLPMNRALYDENHEIYDIIAGPAFICDCSGENFGSLSDEQIKKYSRQFMRPERFYSTRDGVKAVPFQPYQGYER